MTASFRKIDYSLRPAKHAERKMLCEIFRKLAPFQPPEEYRYVGMGSLWFSDFILFHRALGVCDMVSMEHKGSPTRLNANKPFRAITMDFRPTTQALPTLDWRRRQFVWLDYDSPIDLDKLLDMTTVAVRASSGSLLAVSVQCETAKELDEARESGEGSAIERFRSRFGRERVASDVWEDDLVSWRFAKVSRDMLLSEILKALATRNSGKDADDVVEFVPVCDIEYSDGAKMTTLIGIFVEKREQTKCAECRFKDLDFLGQGGTRPVRIEVPKLTVREIRRLEQQLPRAGQEWILDGIPVSDADAFASLYRYLPNFAALEH